MISIFQSYYRSLTALLLTSLYFLIRRKLPYVSRTSIKWVLLSTALIFTHNVIIYSHYVKSVPLGAIGSIIAGCDMISTTFVIYGCLNGSVRYFRLTSSVLIVLGLGLIFYSVINPVLETFTDLELCSQRLTTNCSGIFQGFAIRGNDSVQQLKHNLSDSLMDSQTPRNCSSYEDHATMEISTFFQEMKSSHTIVGILAILISTIPRTVITLTFSGPLKKENIFAVLFWFGFITTSSSLTISWTLENPKISSSKMDILYVVVHAVTVAILSYTKNTAIKYVSPVICEVMVSFSLPLILIVEHFILTFCFEGKKLEIIGASIIFLVIFSIPLLEHYSQIPEDQT